MVKTQRSTSQQSVTQDSDYISNAYTVTQDSQQQQQQPGLAQRLPETDGAKVLPTSDQLGFYLASTHQMAPPEHRAHIRLNRPPADLSTSEGWNAEFA